MELRPSISIISDQLVTRVIDEAVEVLEHVGVMVEHEEARRMLLEAGARSQGTRSK